MILTRVEGGSWLGFAYQERLRKLAHHRADLGRGVGSVMVMGSEATLNMNKREVSGHSKMNLSGPAFLIYYNLESVLLAPPRRRRQLRLLLWRAADGCAILCRLGAGVFELHGCVVVYGCAACATSRQAGCAGVPCPCMAERAYMFQKHNQSCRLTYAALKKTEKD